MTHRISFAWCVGASLGLAVGWLAGQSTRDAITLSRLCRSTALNVPRTGTDTPDPVIGPQKAVQTIPTQRDRDLIGVLMGSDGRLFRLNDDGSCAARTLSGRLGCSATGVHHYHQWVDAPMDRKAQLDSQIE